MRNGQFAKVTAMLGMVAMAAAAAPVPVRPLGAPRPIGKPVAEDSSKLKAALERIASGKGDANALRVKASDTQANLDVQMYGSGVAFAGDVQVKLRPADMTALARKLVDANFIGMPTAFGGVGGPGRGVPEQLLASLELRIGAESKTVTQLAGGQQSKELAALVADLAAVISPLKDKGLKLGGLSLEQVLEGLGKGDVAPEAMTFALTLSPRKPDGKDQFLRFVEGVVTVRGDKGYVDVPLTRGQTEAFAKRAGALLAGKGLEKMPKQLWWPDSLVGLSVSVRGSRDRLSLSADTGPYNQKLKAQHPAEQKAFEEIVRGLLTIGQETPKAAPTKAPHGKPAGDADGPAGRE